MADKIPLNPERLLEAAAVASSLTSAFIGMPENERENAVASLTLTLAAGYMAEMAYHLRAGKEPYDAVLATARGEMKIPKHDELKISLIKLLKTPPAAE